MIRFNSSDTPGSRPSITGQHPCTGRLRNGQTNTVRPYPDSGKTPFRAPGIQIYDLKSKAPRPDTLHLHIRSAFATFGRLSRSGCALPTPSPYEKDMHRDAGSARTDLTSSPGGAAQRCDTRSGHRIPLRRQGNLRQLQSEAARRRNRTEPAAPHSPRTERTVAGMETGLPEPGQRGPHHRSGAVRQHRAGRRDAVPVHAARRPGNRRRPWLDDDRIATARPLDRTRTGRPDRYQSAGPPWGRHHVTYQLCDTVGRARRTPHHPGPRNGRTTCPDPDSTGPGPYRPHPHRRQQCDAPPVLQTRRRSAGRLPIRVAG